jgi:hypothetical protein
MWVALLLFLVSLKSWWTFADGRGVHYICVWGDAFVTGGETIEFAPGRFVGIQIGG